MIDTSAWKEFRVGDLFKIEPAKGKNQQQLIDGDDVPYIAASKENNGFNRMVSVEGYENWVSKGNCLQFVHIGDAAAGHVNYIPVDFIGMSGKSSCAYNDNLNEYTGLFIAGIIVQVNNGKYSFKDSWTGSKVSDTVIKLPATADGQPDWAYMESYMKQIMEETKKSLENLKRDDDSKQQIDVHDWGEFKIGDLFEEVKAGYVGKTKKIGTATKLPDTEHTLPLTCAKYGNCGIMYYGKETDYIVCENVLAVIRDGAISTGMVYAEEKASVYSHSYFIKVRNYDVSFLTNQYLACILTKNIYPKYYRDNTCIWDRIKDDIIKLPITQTGEPDWQYMENYMKNIISTMQNNLTLFQAA